MGLKVGLLYNLKDHAAHLPGSPVDALADLDSETTVQALAEAIAQPGHSVTLLEGDLDLFERLRAAPPDICFNICEGWRGESRESQIPAMLEMLGIPYTGSKVLAQAISLDKGMTKRVLMAYGLPTPPFQQFDAGDQPLDTTLSTMYPLFVKPAWGGTSMGIGAESIVHDEPDLRARIRYILAAYRQPALVEPYVDGVDYTVGVMGNSDQELHVFPIMEVDLSTCPPELQLVYDYKIKSEFPWSPQYHIPARISPPLAAELRRLAIATYRAIGVLDVGRVDFRVDKRTGQPYILEINTLPGLSPGLSDLVLMSEAEGIRYVELIHAIFGFACARYGLTARDNAPLAPGRA